MKKYNDIQAIIKGCKKNNPSAQRALVEDQGDRLYAICIRYIGDKVKAKDALQDCFIRIFKYINKYDPTKGDFEKWLNVLTVRQCFRQLEKKKLNLVEIDAIVQNTLATQPKAIETMSADEILKLVAGLPEGYRQIFNLYAIEGYSHKEISELLGLKESSSRSKLSRAKEMLRMKMFNLKLRSHG